MKKFFLFLIIGFVFFISSFSIINGMKGSGTEADPYQITNWTDLHNIENDFTAYYILMNDLNSSTSDYNTMAGQNANGGKGWVPIGNLESMDNFQGNLNGQNHSIDDLYINSSGEFNGLFVVLFKPSSIKNLGMNRCNITITSNNNTVGCLAGGGVNLIDSTIGVNISNVYIKNSSINAGDSDQVGGFFGVADHVNLTNSYAQVDVFGYSMIGGIFGEVTDEIYVNKVYSTGEVIGEGDAYCDYRSTADVIMDVSNSFCDINVSGQDKSSHFTLKTTSEMKSIETYNDTSTAGLDDAWDITTYSNYSNEHWFIKDGVDYPNLGFNYVEGEEINHPPNSPILNSPGDDSIGVSLNPSLNVSVSDSDGDILNVTFLDESNNIICKNESISSDSNVICNWEGLSSNTTYNWKVEVTDGEFTTEGNSWSFKTISPPYYTLINPLDDESDVSNNPLLNLIVKDIEGDTMDVDFYDASDNSLIGSVENVENNSYANYTWENLNDTTNYQWYAEISDGIFTTKTNIFNFSVQSWSLVATLKNASQPASDLAFSPNNKMIAYGTWGSKNVYVYNTSDWSLITILNGIPISDVSSIAFSPDSELIAYGEMNYGDNPNSPNLVVYYTNNWTIKKTFDYGGYSGDRVWITSIDFSNNGKWMVITHETDYVIDEVEIFNIDDWSINHSISTPHGVRKAKFSPDSNLLAFGNFDYVDGETANLSIYNTSDWSLVKKIEDIDAEVKDISFSSDSSLMAYTHSNTVIKNTNDWTTEKIINEAYSNFVFSEDNNWFLYAFRFGEVKLGQINNWSIHSTFQAGGEKSWGVDFSENNKWFAYTGGSNHICFWCIADNSGDSNVYIRKNSGELIEIESEEEIGGSIDDPIDGGDEDEERDEEEPITIDDPENENRWEVIPEKDYTGTSNWSLDEERTGLYELLMIPGTERAVTLEFQNLGNKSLGVGLSCVGNFCKNIDFKEDSFNLEKNRQIVKKDLIILLPDDIEKGEYNFDVLAQDNYGNTAKIKVKVVVSNLGFFFFLFYKIFNLTFTIGSIKIPYWILSILIYPAIWGIFNYGIAQKIPGRTGISILTSVIFGSVLIYFI